MISTLRGRYGCEDRGWTDGEQRGDMDQVVKWEDCAWRPRELTNV